MQSRWVMYQFDISTALFKSCSVLQCVAVCCKCVAVCCSVLRVCCKCVASVSIWYFNFTIQKNSKKFNVKWPPMWASTKTYINCVYTLLLPYSKNSKKFKKIQCKVASDVWASTETYINCVYKLHCGKMWNLLNFTSISHIPLIWGPPASEATLHSEI